MAADEGSGATRGARSLQDLSAQQVVHELLSESDPEEIFLDLNDVQQKLVFRQFWKEYRRLRQVDKESQERRAWCPTADHDLWSRQWRPIPNPLLSIQADEHDLSVLPDQTLDNDPHNGFNLLMKFSCEWEITTTVRYYREDPRGYQIEFHDSEFLRASPTSPLEVCPEKFKGQHQHLVCDCADRTGTRIPLRVLISSQLLLYRLISIFGGLSETSLGTFVGCWRTILVRKGDETSQLSLCEARREAHARYEGSKEGAKEALKLLDFLVSNNVPWRGDGHLIGTANIQYV